MTNFHIPEYKFRKEMNINQLFLIYYFIIIYNSLFFNDKYLVSIYLNIS